MSGEEKPASDAPIEAPAPARKTLPPSAPEGKTKPKPKAKKMNPPVLVCIVNKSSAPGLKEALPAIVAALGKQLANDVAPVWGNVPALKLAEAPEDGASTITIQDDLDVSGALGYHDETAGVPLGYVGTSVTLANGGTISTGPNSISVTLSHELLELTGDASANLWADAPDGSDYALELCDAVEGDSYDIDGIAVSNFVYKAFFDPQADSTERLDHLGKLTKPFTMTRGGYQIRRTEPGKVSQVFASQVHVVGHQKGRALNLVFGPDFPAWKKAGKLAKARGRRVKAAA